jgi:hypothetical protein
VRTPLQTMMKTMNRITGTGAMLNAWYEVDRAEWSVIELDEQLRRVGTKTLVPTTFSSPRAA